MMMIELCSIVSHLFDKKMTDAMTLSKSNTTREFYLGKIKRS
jgi:hypothetical protein